VDQEKRIVKNINYALLITTVGIAAYIGVKKLGYSEIQILSNGSLLPLFRNSQYFTGLEN